MADFTRFAFTDSDSIPFRPKRTFVADVNESSEKKGKKVTRTLELSKECAQTDDIASHGLHELYRSPGRTERPLKLVIVGHNPSEQSWTKGHYYANPSNRMWYLLRVAGIVPDTFKATDDQRCPSELGVGFTDIMTGISGTHSCKFSDLTVQSHRYSLFKRLEAHVQRAHSASGVPHELCYPRVIAFAGVRQWKALFPACHFQQKRPSLRKAKNVAKQPSILKHLSVPANECVGRFGSSNAGVLEEGADQGGGDLDVEAGDQAAAGGGDVDGSAGYGVQAERPPGWPECLRSSVVFLLPSSSGAAAMTNAQREGPYRELGLLLGDARFAWVEGKGLAELEQYSECDVATPQEPFGEVDFGVGLTEGDA